MGRTANTIWIINIYTDIEKTDLFKVIEVKTLKEISYIMNKKIFEISNFYHKIKKPDKIFKFITIYKSII